MIANLTGVCTHGVNLLPQRNLRATDTPDFGAWAAIVLHFENV
jgi:hypothetical protein